MPLDPKRKGDIKVIVGATVAVLLVGFFIFGAMIVTTRGGQGVQCGRLNIGLATDVVVPNAHLAGRPEGSKLTTRGSTGVPAE